MRKNYATELTKDYLIELGITNVTPDGYHVYWKGEELTQHCHKAKKAKKSYLRVSFYSAEVYKNTPEEERTRSTGTMTFLVHVLNYVWNRGDRPEGFIVDHIDNNQLNNNIDNLQLLTPAENLAKERGESIKQVKCKLDRPLSYYEDKLKMYEEKYEEAKKAHDASLAHKLRSNISNTRAKIRYYEAHIEEARQLLEAKANTQTKSKEYHERAAEIRDLKNKIKNARYHYDEALKEYGADDYIVQDLKVKWKLAIYDYNKYLVEHKTV